MVKGVIYEIFRTKGEPKFIIFGYLDGTLNVYLSVPSNLMDASNHLICLFLSCPVYAAAHAVPF
jgi:hypothetical protein